MSRHQPRIPTALALGVCQVVKKELPYFNAIMTAIARHPDRFRRIGYTISEMRFSQHKQDKKGKLVSCVADFGDRVPTDAEIERTCKIGCGKSLEK